MTEQQISQHNQSAQTAHEIAHSESGRRDPRGLERRVLIGTLFAWSLFQLWYASPLPFLFEIGVLNSNQARSVHLAFALFLAFTAYPAFRRSPHRHIPIQDWVFAIAGAFAGGYLFLFYQQLSQRPGAPITQDVVVACIGMVLLLEAVRRSLGPPLAVVAIVLLGYTYFGPYMPGVIAHKGASLNAIVNHQWVTTEGVYGVALGVSTDFVFLFVLFGALLERAGAGNYFIKVAFSLLGHMRGGPAKAAVLASASTGLISGSSIANVVTTGTFTIPLMKRVGFSGRKAGAIEVAASVNGQLMPPIMGAAAFLMVEYVGIPYVEVIKHAFLPAIISYIALLYIVHLEAVKAGMQGLPRPVQNTLAQRLLSLVMVLLGLIVLSGLVYYGIGWTKDVFGDAARWIVGAGIFAAYIGLLGYAARVPELEEDDPQTEHVELPRTAPTVKAGLHFLLPVVVLVWCLVVERFSPGLSAFWATALMMSIVVTQRPILAMFRGRDRAAVRGAGRHGAEDLFRGLVTGARNMIGIGVATAAAGIVVGTVTLTGIGLVMTEFVEVISGGNMMLMLLFTAFICLVLGLGLPTTANYIVVSALMAPVIVNLGAEHGLTVPLIAVHLFVFYFGILADDTPPVGLAAYAAAAISRDDPVMTGVQGFAYDIRTAVLPFMFLFNNQLLLIGIDNWWQLAITISSAIGAMLVFAAATQGFLLTRSRWWETAALLLVAFTLFRPGFWTDLVWPPLEQATPAEVIDLAGRRDGVERLLLAIEGEALSGERVTKSIEVPLTGDGDGEARLESVGLLLRADDGRMLVDDVIWGSPAYEAGIEFDWEIKTVQLPLAQPSKYWMLAPGLALLLLVAGAQRLRARA